MSYICKTCGYIMDDFDNECKRCKMLSDNASVSPNSFQRKIPSPVEGWSWGAFAFSWIWSLSLCHRFWILFLALDILFIFPLTLIPRIWLGCNGHRISWENGQNQDTADFKRVMSIWNMWGMIWYVTISSLFFLGFIVICLIL